MGCFSSHVPSLLPSLIGNAPFCLLPASHPHSEASHKKKDEPRSVLAKAEHLAHAEKLKPGLSVPTWCFLS